MAPRLHNDRLHLEWFGETCFYRGSCIFLLWKDTRRSLEIVLSLNIAENYIPCHSMTSDKKREARSKTLAISVSLVSGSGAGEQTNWTTCPRHSRAAQLCLQRSNRSPIADPSDKNQTDFFVQIEKMATMSALCTFKLLHSLCIE